MEGLKRVTVPARLFLLDNGSTDGTPDELARAIADLPFPAHVLRSVRNNGFARGMNLLAAQGNAEYIFVLNPDTVVEAGSLELLVAKMDSDPRIAICEARQAPRPHHKTYDPQTGETTWCSGAAALIRRRAFEEVGGFDGRAFFIYCEDIDLSWKLWLSGWKCIYAPDAVVNHYTQDLVPGKRRTRENYFGFRNSLFLFYRFGSWKERRVLWRFLVTRFLTRKYSIRSKALFAIALADHVRYIAYLFRSGRTWRNRKHPWIRFSETSLAD